MSTTTAYKPDPSGPFEVLPPGTGRGFGFTTGVYPDFAQTFPSLGPSLMDGLYDHWSFDGTLVGVNGRTFSAPVPAYAAGHVTAQALSLDGTANTVATCAAANDLSLDEQYIAMTGWVYFPTLASTNAIVTNIPVSGSGGFTVRLTSLPKLTFLTGIFSATYAAVSLANGTWAFFAFNAVFSTALRPECYVDNGAVQDFTPTTNSNAPGSLIIGQRAVGGGIMTGRLNSLSIWKNRKLTADEILYIWNNGAGRYPFV